MRIMCMYVKYLVNISQKNRISTAGGQESNCRHEMTWGLNADVYVKHVQYHVVLACNIIDEYYTGKWVEFFSLKNPVVGEGQ